MMIRRFLRDATVSYASILGERSFGSQAIMNSGIQSNYCEVNGLKVHYDKVGHGPHNVLLLPGALGSSTTDFFPQLTEMDQTKFTIYAWDPVGYGKSRPPNRTWPDNFFRRDAADTAALLSKLGLTNVSLVGWSDGGITAMVVAVYYPTMVNKMVLFGANAYVTSKDIQLYEEIRDLKKWSPKMREPFERVYGRQHFEELWNAWIDATTSYLTKHSGNIIRDKIHEICKPVLIIHGQKDPLVPQEHPDFLHSQIKGSRLVNWPDAKHNLHLRYAKEFNQLISEFLQESAV